MQNAKIKMKNDSANMKNIDERSDLAEKVSQLSEELGALKSDHQETKDRLMHWEHTWFEVKNTFYLAGALVGFIVVGAILKLVIREWPTFLAGAIWLVGSVLVLWLIVSVIRFLTRSTLKLFRLRKR